MANTEADDLGDKIARFARVRPYAPGKIGQACGRSRRDLAGHRTRSPKAKKAGGWK